MPMPDEGWKLTLVAGGIIRRAGLFLACRRPCGKPLAGYWEFPGGKLEPGETAEAALRRELREELSISVESCAFYCAIQYPYPDHGIMVELSFFEVLRFRGEPKASEGQTLAWVSPAQALELAFLPADAEILRKLAANV